MDLEQTKRERRHLSRRIDQIDTALTNETKARREAEDAASTAESVAAEVVSLFAGDENPRSFRGTILEAMARDGETSAEARELAHRVVGAGYLRAIHMLANKEE